MNINKIKHHEDRYRRYIRDVEFKYQLFSGLFLSLPFEKLDESGAVLAIFAKQCEDGLKNGLTAREIILQFVAELKIEQTQINKLLLKFLQFIERQVVLFDSLEDAAFNEINDLHGNGTVDHFLHQVILDEDNKAHLLDEILAYYKVRVVLTAHPTQFYPNQILTIIADLGQAIKNNNLDEIRGLFLQLGMTRFTNSKKPTPLDEAISLIWYLENVFYTELSQIQEKLTSKYINLELGFWPGGDRDGNPYVIAETTLAVANRLNTTIKRLYQKDLRFLRRKLTFSGIYEKINEMVYAINEDKYHNVEQVIQELELIKQQLEDNYQGISVEYVDRFILRLKMFEFYFVKIDIRQNSAIHAQVVDEIFKVNKIHDDYINLSEDAKIQLLKSNILRTDLIDKTYSNLMVKEVFDTIFAIHKIQQTNGINAIERYIISNTDSLASIFEVYFFISMVNNYLKLNNYNKLIKLEIVPLFETIDDLVHAESIMEALYTDNEYQELLSINNHHQTIMLGFSDGTKDGGYLMANWSIYMAKKNLTLLSNKYGINVVFFDGRGGPPSRGGGNTRDFYHSMGANVATREIQLTVQGQTISSKFGTAESANYNLEQLFTSGLMSKIFPEKSEAISIEDEELIAILANECYQVYLDLRHDPLFVPYLEEITPLKYLAQTNIGSRPMKRNKDSKLRFEDLRAIPFVGSWTQMKQNILGYYGLGSGINNLIKRDKSYLTKLINLYQSSLFFRTLINNAMQSLSKSNFAITKHLEHDPKFGVFWQKLYNETELTHRMLLQLTGHEELLSMDIIEQESINIREKIILPLLIIQQYALDSIRRNEGEIDFMERLVKKSLAANINASRNSV